MAGWRKGMLITFGVAVAGVAGFSIWFVNRGDDPLDPRLPSADAAAVAVAVAVAPTTAAPPAVAVADIPVATPTPTGPQLTGVRQAVPGDRTAYFVGYEITEAFGILGATATGTTGTYTGTLEIDDAITALDLTVDLRTLESDEAFRDELIRNDVLQTGLYPFATFTADAPIALPPGLSDGDSFTVAVTGQLTLREISAPVAFSVDGRWQGDVVELAGTIPFALPTYGIGSVPGGVVAIRDDAEIAFVVAFSRSGS